MRRRISYRRLTIALLLLLLLLAALIKFGLWLHYRYTHAVTEDAFVEADIINISPLVSGHIKKILVDESQYVKKGDLLFIIDDRDYRAEVEVKRAELKAAKRELEVLRAKLSQAQKDLELTRRVVLAAIKAASNGYREAEATFERVSKDYRRFKKLYYKKVIGKRKFDLITEEYKRSSSILKIRRAELDMALARKKEIEIKREIIREIEKRIKATLSKIQVAKKALNMALINLEHTRVKSPIDGIVAKKYLFEGDFVSPGYPVLALYDPKTIYVIANLEETRFKGVKVGNPVDIKVDAYPGKVFRGKVMKILKASAAKFALIPRDVTAGEFTKVVQRIPIKIEIVDKDKALLIPGMSVFVGIEK